MLYLVSHTAQYKAAFVHADSNICHTRFIFFGISAYQVVFYKLMGRVFNFAVVIHYHGNIFIFFNIDYDIIT